MAIPSGAPDAPNSIRRSEGQNHTTLSMGPFGVMRPVVPLLGGFLVAHGPPRYSVRTNKGETSKIFCRGIDLCRTIC